MARPVSYDWNKIKTAFEGGITKAEICEEYGIKMNTLNIQIKRGNWCVNHLITNSLAAVKDGFLGLETALITSPALEPLISDKLTTILEDNFLIGGNRKLLKSFQSLIKEGIKNGIYDNPASIKAGVSAIRDIEAVANPQSAKTSVNVQNNISVIDPFKNDN